MERRRATWLVSSILLLCAGLATGWATYLWWLPCRGVMLVGTILETGDAELPQECLVRMDQGPPMLGQLADAHPLLNVAFVLALLAGSLAWLVLVVGLPWTGGERSGVVPLAVVLGVSGPLILLLGVSEPSLILIAVDLAIFAAFMTFAMRVVRGDRVVRRAWIPLLGLGALGLIAKLLDYVAMIAWSSLNWDTPPGTGYLSAAALVVAAIVTVAVTVYDGRPQSDVSEAHGQREAPRIGSLPA